MEGSNVNLFRINYMPNLLVILLSSAIVTSSPRKEESIVDAMKKDANLCDSIKVLYESEYIKNCATLEWPTQTWDKGESSLDKYMCLGVYDTAYKICRYSDRLSIALDSVDTFDSYVRKYVPDNKLFKTEENKEENYCKKNLQGFTLLYNKTELYWGPLVEKLSKPPTCQRACFDFNLVFRPLCAVFAWIKSIDDEIKKLNATSHNFATSDSPKTSADHQDVIDSISDKKQLEINSKEIEMKTEAKEPKGQSYDKVKDASSNIPKEQTQLNTEKAESGFEKLSKQGTQKISSVPSSKIQDHISRERGRESTSKIETNTAVPKVSYDVPSKENVITKDVKEVNAEETDRKLKDEEIKSSTISENTQDLDNMEGNIEDSEDLDITGQEPMRMDNLNDESKGELLKYDKEKQGSSNISTEDDSHFFTYFTVTTVACIACYIGYHNKQKILAIVLEGRKSKNSRGRRRPSTASYRKLDCTLEEAVTSQCNANVTHVIY